MLWGLSLACQTSRVKARCSVRRRRHAAEAVASTPAGDYSFATGCLAPSRARVASPPLHMTRCAAVSLSLSTCYLPTGSAV